MGLKNAAFLVRLDHQFLWFSRKCSSPKVRARQSFDVLGDASLATERWVADVQGSSRERWSEAEPAP